MFRLSSLGRCGLVAAMTLVAGFAPAAEPAFPWLRAAPPLPKPAGDVIRVANVDELFAAAERVAPGGTILVADGQYFLPRYFELHTDNVTLRSESGRRGEGRAGRGPQPAWANWSASPAAPA